jgi:hypothetical protein
MADNLAQRQFYGAMRNNIARTLLRPFDPIQDPAQGVPPWRAFNRSQVFNMHARNESNPESEAGIERSSQLMAAAAFPNAYVQLLQGIEGVSKDDRKAVNSAQWAASLMAEKIISDYQRAFGSITDEDIATAQMTCGKFAVLNKQDYVVAYVLGYLWSGQQAIEKPPLPLATMASAKKLERLLPMMPSSGLQVATDVSIYLNILTLGNASIQAIKSDLENTSRVLEFSLNTSQTQGGELNITIDGGMQFKVGSWLMFQGNDGRSYDMSKTAGTSADAAITIRIEGYSVLPVSTNMRRHDDNQKWTYKEPIAQAFESAFRMRSRFDAAPHHDRKTYANDDTFGIVTGLFIANPPIIKILYSNADYSAFQHWRCEGVSGGLELFGIPLANLTKSIYTGKYKQGSSNSTFTLTFAPSR